MAYFINDKCTSCNACKPECPTGSIFVGSPYLIDRDTCRDCALCAGVCPVNAIARIPGSAKPKPLRSEQKSEEAPK